MALRLKKLAVWLLIMSLCACLCACEGAEDSGESPAETSSMETQTAEFGTALTGVGRAAKISSESSAENIMESEPSESAPAENILSLSFSDASDLSIKVGETVKPGFLHAEVLSAERFSLEDVVFISENPQIAAVAFVESSQSDELCFEVSGLSAGETSIYAASKSGAVMSGKLHVTVTEPITVQKIELYEYTSPLTVGESTTAKAEILPTDAEDKTVIWHSSNASVAAVDASGNVTAVGAGTATITAAAQNGVSASFDIRVNEKIEESTSVAEVPAAPSVPAKETTATAASENKAIASEPQQADIAASTAEATAAKASMKVHISCSEPNNSKVGSDWTYVFEINGNKVSDGSTIDVAAGETLTFYAEFTENDKRPDIGTAKETYKVTEAEIQSGFECKMKLSVRENGGRYSGETATFDIAFKIQP